MVSYLASHSLGLLSSFSTKESVFTVGNDNFLKELEISDLQVVKELNAGAILGQIAMSNSEHVLFAGTSDVGKPGCIRAYNFPLTGDYFEVMCPYRNFFSATVTGIFRQCSLLSTKQRPDFFSVSYYRRIIILFSHVTSPLALCIFHADTLYPWYRCSTRAWEHPLLVCAYHEMTNLY